MNWQQLDLSLDGLRAHYHRRDFNPAQLVDELCDRAQRCAHKNIWISPPDQRQLRPYLQRLESESPDSLPLVVLPDPPTPYSSPLVPLPLPLPYSSPLPPLALLALPAPPEGRLPRRFIRCRPLE